MLLILISACSKTPYLPYHSTAEIPRVTSKTITEMRQAKLENVKTNYAVIAAVDNKEIGYLLFASAFNSGNVESTIPENFWDFDITLSTAIPPNDVDELISVTEEIINHWENLEVGTDGLFYEYSQTLEQDVARLSSNVVEYKPAVKIYFNITEEGSTGRLIIGEGDLKSFYKIDSKTDLIVFKRLLERGQEILDEML